MMQNVLPQRTENILPAEPPADARISLARKLGYFSVGRLFRKRERAFSNDTLHAITRDIEVEVRKALAQTIAANSDLPQDTAIRLANDVIELAEPTLTFKDILEDQALYKIVMARSEAHHAAVAARQTLSESVTLAIGDNTMTSPAGKQSDAAEAQIDQSTLEKTVEQIAYGANASEISMGRQTFPLPIAERLVGLVSERLRNRFAESGPRLRDYADGLSAQITEGAALILGGGETDTLDLLNLVDQMKATGKLQPTLIIKAGALGEAELMYAAISRLSGLKYSAVSAAFKNAETARTLLYDVGLVPCEVDELLSAYKL